jgi:hypothetical protein
VLTIEALSGSADDEPRLLCQESHSMTAKASRVKNLNATQGPQTPNCGSVESFALESQWTLTIAIGERAIPACVVQAGNR